MITTATAGLANGRMMKRKTWNSLAPSIRACSEISIGSPRKNCLIKKMKKGFPKNAGTMIGRNVSTHCNFAKMSKSATISTGNGRNIDAMTIPKTKSRPGHLMREKPYAIKGLEIADPIVTPAVSTTELRRNVPKGM